MDSYTRTRIRYPDEPLWQNCRRLVPDSRNNFCHYFALLSIEHFFALVAQQQFTVVFSFDQSIAYLLIFFNWCDKVALFLFFPNIYIFPQDSDSLYIFIFELLAVFFPYRKCYYSVSYIYIYIYKRERERIHTQLPPSTQTFMTVLNLSNMDFILTYYFLRSFHSVPKPNLFVLFFHFYIGLLSDSIRLSYKP